MSFQVPDDRKYLESHEWVETEDRTVRVGITDFAQDELGDVVFVELPSEGDAVQQGEEFGVVESIKAVSDLYSPVSGTVVAANDALKDQPELVNSDPFGDGWMLEVELDGDGGLDELLSADEYGDGIE